METLLDVTKDLPDNPELTVEKLKSICEELFPEREVYFRTSLFGRFAVVSIDKFTCIFCKVLHNDGIMRVSCEHEDTKLGSLLGFGIINWLFTRRRGGEIMETIIKEIERRYAK